jgi:hypothetical protein
MSVPLILAAVAILAAMLIPSSDTETPRSEL